MQKKAKVSKGNSSVIPLSCSLILFYCVTVTVRQYSERRLLVIKA